MKISQFISWNLNRKFFTIAISMLLAINAWSQEPVKGNSIPFKFDDNRIVIPARFANTDTVWLFLDSENLLEGVYIFNPGLKKKFNNSSSEELNNVGIFQGAVLTAGDMTFSNLLIIMSENYRGAGVGTDGSIGGLILNKNIIGINMDDSIISIPDKAPELDSSHAFALLYRDANRLPIVEVSVKQQGESEEKPMKALIDLNFGGMIGAITKEGEEPGSTPLSFDEFSIGGTSFKDMKAEYNTNRMPRSHREYDIRIGIGLLKQFNLHFDYGGGKLYMAPGKFHKP